MKEYLVVYRGLHEKIYTTTIYGETLAQALEAQCPESEYVDILSIVKVST